VPAAIAADPDLVTVWLVVNDGLRGVEPRAYQADLRTLLDRLTRETHAVIVLLNAPDISQILPPQTTPTTRQAVQMLAQQWNGLIAREAAAYPDRVLLVDLYGPSQQAVERPDWVSPDRFHPSSAGYGALADVVYTAMQDAGLLAPQP
jgi:lysophospholipase L1-like esterase